MSYDTKYKIKKTVKGILREILLLAMWAFLIWLQT